MPPTIAAPSGGVPAKGAKYGSGMSAVACRRSIAGRLSSRAWHPGEETEVDSKTSVGKLPAGLSA